jgi:hypothetical protein
MSRLLRGLALLCLLLTLAALPALAQVQSGNDNNDAGAGALAAHQTPGNPAQPLPVFPVTTRFHGVPWRDANAPIGFAAPAGAHLTYFGGPIISNVQVIQVLYGSGSYNAQVAGTASPSMQFLR